MSDMNLVQNKNHTYSVWFPRSEWPPRGRLVSLKTVVGHAVTDPEEAAEILRVLQKKKLEERLIELDRGQRISLEAFTREYIAGRADLDDDTLRADSLALRLLAGSIGGSTAMRTIGDEHVKKFMRDCRARGVKPVSINTYLRHLRAAFRKAIDAGYIRKLPDMTRQKVPKRLPKVLKRSELNLIIALAEADDPDMARIIRFALWTGARLSEIHGLKWQHVTGDHARIVGKGDRERNIPLTPDAISAMGDRRNIGPVFSQCHKNNYSHRFKALAIAAGAGHANFHQLRHSAASYMIESGMHPKAVQKILGHADFRTTELYIELNNDFLSTEIEKLRII